VNSEPLCRHCNLPQDGRFIIIKNPVSTGFNLDARYLLDCPNR
jgi:hypothetical protein